MYPLIGEGRWEGFSRRFEARSRRKVASIKPDPARKIKLLQPLTQKRSPRIPVLDIQEEQCKRKADQSGPEENHLVGQALTYPISIDNLDNKVDNSRSRV
ncbi:hypothetical protein TNCV_2236801 [Trichonephila clavipes]|nr:hypothetical protein TNCV_2236801 [Trichonephila clavipes]